MRPSNVRLSPTSNRDLEFPFTPNLPELIQRSRSQLVYDLSLAARYADDPPTQSFYLENARRSIRIVNSLVRQNRKVRENSR